MNTRFSYRHQYDEVRDAIERERTDIVNEEPSMTQQQFADEVNLNVIMARFGVTDQDMPLPAIDPSHYGDFTDVFEYRDALDRLRNAEAAFSALPADIRNRFQNDPTKLWEFVNDPKNDDEAIKLGLLKKIDGTPGATSSPADPSPGNTASP